MNRLGGSADLGADLRRGSLLVPVQVRRPSHCRCSTCSHLTLTFTGDIAIWRCADKHQCGRYSAVDSQSSGFIIVRDVKYLRGLISPSSGVGDNVFPSMPGLFSQPNVTRDDDGSGIRQEQKMEEAVVTECSLWWLCSTPVWLLSHRFRNKPLMVLFHLEDCPHSQGEPVALVSVSNQPINQC